jgi:hypothetical protein
VLFIWLVIISICAYTNSLVDYLPFQLKLEESNSWFHLASGLLDSPEKSFFLPIYAKVMARASPLRRLTCAPRPRYGIDPRILNFIDISATVDTSFPTDCSLFS